jgi:hypothetical protein
LLSQLELRLFEGRRVSPVQVVQYQGYGYLLGRLLKKLHYGVEGAAQLRADVDSARSKERACFCRLEVFSDAFRRRRKLLVGGDGIALESFLSPPPLLGLRRRQFAAARQQLRREKARGIADVLAFVGVRTERER